MSDEKAARVDSHEAFLACDFVYRTVKSLPSDSDRRTLARFVLPVFEEEMEKVDEYVRGHSRIKNYLNELKSYVNN